MLSLLLGLSLVQVEIPAQVAPLGRLLPELGKRLDQKLFADASVRDDVMAVASPARPAQEILDGIAAAANATWEKRPEGLVLVRSRRQELEDEETDAKFREAWILNSLKSTPVDTPFDETRAKALADYWFEFKSKKEYEPSDYAQLDTMNARSPLGRFTRRLVEAFRVPELARVPQRTVTVYSTRPTKMQRPMPVKNFDALIAEFTEEQNRYAAAIKAKGVPQDGHTGQFVSGFDTVNPINSSYAKVRVAIDTSSPSQTFLRVEFSSAQGQTLASARAYLNRGFDTPVPGKRTDVDIELDQESRTLIAAIKERPGLFHDEAMFIFDVIQRDPLENVHREGVRAWSQTLRMPVFALLPDASIIIHATAPYRLEAYLRDVAAHSIMVESDQRVIVRPLAPAEAHVSRIHRQALQRAIDVRKSQRRLSINAAVDFASSIDLRSDPSSSLLVGLALPEYRNMNPSGLISIIAHAIPSQRQELLAGSAVRLRDLNPVQRTLVERLIYGQARSGFFGVTTRIDAKDPLPAEPTEAFPDGIPDTFVLRTESSEGDGAKFKQANFRIPYSLSELAQMASYEQMNGMEFQFCKVRLLRFDVTLNASRGYEAVIREARGDPKAEWGPYESLPKALRDEVERQAEILRQRRTPPP